MFEKGEGEPLVVTHLYSAYNERGNTVVNPFTNHYKMYLINVRGVSNVVRATGGMLALKCAGIAQASLTKIIAIGSAASIEYAVDVGNIYCHQNPHDLSIEDIMRTGFNKKENLHKIYARLNRGNDWSSS